MRSTPDDGTGLHCPPEWADIITQAMASALPEPRAAGLDAVRVGLLIRQSKAREDDSQGSPRAQLDAGLRLVRSPAHSGWHVAPEDVFADIGVSGWSSAVTHPGFDAMMRKVRAGKLDVVIIFSLSRLSRMGALDVLGILDEFAQRETRLVSVIEPWLDTDPGNAVGRALLALTAALAQQESEQKSLLITGAHAQARQRGGHVSGRPPYGFMVERVTVDGVIVNKLAPDPATAPVVEDIVQWTLDGKLDRREIAAKLTKRGTPTPTGKRTWIASTVRSIVRDPRLAGYSVEPFTRIEKDDDGKPRRRPVSSSHAIMYGPDGNPVRLHDGIITRDEWWKLQVAIGNKAELPRRRNPRRESIPVGHFTRLQLLHCGVCGRPMQTNPGRNQGSRYAFYTCNTGPGGPLGAGRHSMGITVAQVDDLIPRMALQRLAALSPEDSDDLEVLTTVAERLTRESETEEARQQKEVTERELEQVRAALKALAADREAGVYEGPAMTAVYRDSNRRLAATEAQLKLTIQEIGERGDRAVSLPVEWFEAGTDPIGPGSAWAGWGMTTRRAFLLATVESAQVAPVGRKGNHTPVKDRISVKWVGERGQQDE